MAVDQMRPVAEGVVGGNYLRRHGVAAAREPRRSRGSVRLPAADRLEQRLPVPEQALQLSRPVA